MVRKGLSKHEWNGEEKPSPVKLNSRIGAEIFKQTIYDTSVDKQFMIWG
jgi:hypothetical protein